VHVIVTEQPGELTICVPIRQQRREVT